MRSEAGRNLGVWICFALLEIALVPVAAFLLSMPTMTTKSSSIGRVSAQQDSCTIMDGKENKPENAGQAQTTKARPRHVHVEVVLHPLCSTREDMQDEWQHFLESDDFALQTSSGAIDMSTTPDSLRKRCLSARLVSDDMSVAGSPEKANNTVYHIHPYTLSGEEATMEELAPTDGGDEWTTACENLPLPHASLESSWESLILARGVKQKLLSYAQSALLFSDKGVSSHLVNWNRLLLLHGPPGCAKTSLCRALAHKLAIRLSDRFPKGANLLEIQSHSLFSKWFSTSGKLISRLFELIRDMVEDDPESLVCVLVDEVESLAGSRTALGGAGEPSDAVRAVNALLTSLDRLRMFPNVLVLTTTNLTASVDMAFVDRADVKQYIGLPILEARYEILRSCVEELVRVGIVRAELSDQILRPFQDVAKSIHILNTAGCALMHCAKLADGLSGRSLRRLPLQSHAQFVGTPEVNMGEFLEALRRGVEEEQVARVKLQQVTTATSHPY